MLKSVEAIMKKYIKEKGKLILDGDILDDSTMLEHMSSAGSILSLITKSELHSNILKYISPHFNFDINKVKKANRK